MPPEITPELIEAKSKQRAALRKEYLKHISNPHLANEGGHIFDPALQRWLSMRVTQIDFYKDTPKTIGKAFLLFILPIGLSYYFITNSRAKKEAAYRAGEVSYKDRTFKLR